MLSNVFILLVGLRSKIFLILNFNFFSIRRNFDGGRERGEKSHFRRPYFEGRLFCYRYVKGGTFTRLFWKRKFLEIGCLFHLHASIFKIHHLMNFKWKEISAISFEKKNRERERERETFFCPCQSNSAFKYTKGCAFKFFKQC